MDDFNERLAKSFGVKAKKIMRQREGIVISDNTGIKLLKKTDKPLEKIMFSHEAKEYLFNKGFDNIDRYACSAKGVPYVQVDNATYIMTEQPQTEAIGCNFANMTEVLATAKILAHIHNNLNGLDAPNKRIDIKTLKLPDYYACRLKELKHIKKWILNKSHMSDFDLLLLKNFKYLTEKLQEAVSILNSHTFKDICNKTRAGLLVCHNEIKEENIKLTGNTIFISGFEECGYGHNIFDLSELIRHCIKSGCVDNRLIHEIINQYCNINHLSNNEVTFMFYKLKTPDKILKLINQHYNHRRTWTSKTKADNFEKLLAQYRLQVSIIDNVMSTSTSNPDIND